MEAIPSRVIYVGSIPYDQTEEQILDIFRSVGPVANFRLVFDKESGKSKGFGFVEYHDPETAASAVRNLNNYQIGSRNLKVDFSHETSITAPALFPSSYTDFTLPSLPPGTLPPQGMPAHDAINNTLMTLTRDQMLGIILDLKTMSQKNPSLARELFNVSPQLSYMAVQCLLMLNIIDNNTVFSLVNQSYSQPSQPSAPIQQQQQQQQLQNFPLNNSNSNYQQSSIQPNGAPNTRSYMANPSQGLNGPGSSLHNLSSQHPPPQQQSQPLGIQSQVPDSEPENNQQLELIKRVMLLTDEQVSHLSKEQRDALNLLRERVRNGEFPI